MERMIKVTGKGKISVKPDTVRLVIRQEGIRPVYEEAVRASAARKAELNEIFEQVGLDRSDLKTLHFDIDTTYESYQERDKSWKKRFLGYTFTHRMKIEFPMDNDFLGRVLGAISRCPGTPEFRIEFTVKDPEPVKNELLGKAVSDSREKAEHISRAAGVTLGRIINIDYSWGQIDLVSRCMDDRVMEIGCCAKTEALSMDIEPDDIDMEDTVTVMWEIS